MARPKKSDSSGAVAPKATKKKKEVSFEEALWKSADKLRGAVEPAEYKFGFPPVVIDDVYKEVLEQAENYKRNLPAFSGFFYPDVEEKVMEAAEEEK